MNIPRTEDLMLFYLPLVYVGIVAELFASKITGKKTYTAVGFFQNFNITVGQMVLHAGLLLFYVGLYASVQSHARVAFRPAWPELLALFVALDLLHYAFHRASHRIGLLWGVHLVHHACNDFNLSTSGRTPWLKSLFLLPLYLGFALLGVPLNVLLLVVLATHLLQFWVHTRFFRRVPWLDYVFINPSFHRAHHGVEPRYIDRNYAEVLPVWDHLFGTYAPEVETPTFGLVEAVDMNRPAYHNFFYFLFLARLARLSRDPIDLLRVWIKPPGWKPDGVSEERYLALWRELAGPGLPGNRPKRAIGRSLALWSWALFAIIYLATGVFFVVLDKKNYFVAGASVLILAVTMEIQGRLIDRGLAPQNR